MRKTKTEKQKLAFIFPQRASGKSYTNCKMKDYKNYLKIRLNYLLFIILISQESYNDLVRIFSV